MEIIPAIDIIDGKCVRLSQGNFSTKKMYDESPLTMAKRFEETGLRRLHLVDLDGAKKGKITNLAILEEICSKTSLSVDFGGGIKTGSDIRSVFDAGAAMASVGSIAVKRPGVFYGWLQKYGAEKIFLGADVKDEKLVISGWTEQTGLPVFDFIENNFEKGVRNFFCTDIAKDGMLAGSSVGLYKKITALSPFRSGARLYASGGISSVDDLLEAEKAGCAGAIVGKAIYEGRISLKELAGI